MAAALRVHHDDLLQQRRELLKLVDRRPELEDLGVPIARIGRLHREVLPTHRLAFLVLHRVQPPRRSSGHRDQPALPAAIAVGLVAEELDPRERARVLDHFPRRVHARRDRLLEFELVLAVEVELVAAEPYRGLIAALFDCVPGGRCTSICPRRRGPPSPVIGGIGRYQGLYEG
jgi:hypothetical protein